MDSNLLPNKTPSYSSWKLSLLATACGIGALTSGYFAWREARRPAVLLLVKQPRVEMGSAVQQHTYPVEFLLQNGGRETLEVMSVEGSCSCVAFKLPQTEIAPGESLPLTVKFSTGDSVGAISSSICVVFRAEGASQLYRQWLEIAATVKSGGNARRQDAKR